MYRIVQLDYALSDIERFVALSIRRGSSFASLERNDPTGADARSTAGASLLFWPGEALPRKAALERFSAFLAGPGDWLAASPEELLERLLSLELLEERPEGFVSRLEPLPQVSARRLVDELESARTILAERRSRQRAMLQARNRAANDPTPPVDPEVDAAHMREALEDARAAAEAGEIPVGAVLVAEDGHVLARTGNRTIRDADPTAHAEILALREAARLTANHRLAGTTLYVTLEPCPMCAGAIAEARVSRVVFGAGDPRRGALGGAFDLSAVPGVNHRPRVTTGVLADACAGLLKDFFAERRAQGKS